MKNNYIITSFIIKLIVSIIVIAAINVGVAMVFDFDILLHVIITIIVFIIALIFDGAKMKYLQNFKYQLDDNNINITRGVFIKRYEKFPIRRIQHVRYEQHLIQRQFKVATVSAITSGEVGVIEMLTLEEAKELVDNINSSLNIKLDEES